MVALFKPLASLRSSTEGTLGPESRRLNAEMAHHSGSALLTAGATPLAPQTFFTLARVVPLGGLSSRS